MTKDQLAEMYLSVPSEKFEERLMLYLDQNKKQLSTKLKEMKSSAEELYVSGTVEEFEKAASDYFWFHLRVSDVYVKSTTRIMSKLSRLMSN